MKTTGEHTLRKPSPSFWWINSVGWFALTIINIIFQTEYFTENFEAIGYSFLITIPSFGVTFLTRYVILRFRIIEKPIRYIIPYLLIITIVATCLCVFTFSGLIISVFPGQIISIGELFRNVFQFGLIVLIWILLYGSFLFFQNQQQLNEQQLKLSLQLKEAELNNLRKQLSPHFLFNSLNNIHALIRIDPEKAREAILNLSDLLRYVLNYQKKTTVTVDEEMEIVTIYMQLNSIHLGNNVTFETAIDPALRNLHIPPLSIQLLVENALKHGSIVDALITVKGYRQQGKSIIEVTNPGTIGQKDKEGIGIPNLQHRLTAVFGQNVTFEMFEKEKRVVSQIIIVSCV